MGQTPNYAIAYPECDPPLRKDASDVIQFRDLAVGIDDAIQGLYDDATNKLFSPDTCRMSGAAPLTVTGQDAVALVNTVSYDNSPGSMMGDVTNGGIRILEPGRYWIGAYALITSATELSARMRFLSDGAPISNFQSPSGIYTASTAYCYASAVLAFTAPALLQVGIRHSASSALSWSYQARLWAIQALKD